MSGYAALLKNLRDVEGPKSMIILSQGLMLDGAQSGGIGAGDARGRGARQRQRADVRAADAATPSQARLSETQSQDRDLARGRPRDARVPLARLALSRA